MDLSEYNISQINNDYFRMLIFGSSGSGKTYFTLHKLLPELRKRYHQVFLISPSYLKSQYEQVIPRHCLTHIDCHKFKKGYELKDVLKMIQATIEKTKIGRDQTGHTMYKYKTLIIFDDALHETVDQELSNSFAHFRHYQTSLIFLSQHTKKICSPMMLGNTNFIVMFNMKGQSKLDCINMLREYTEGTSEKEQKSIANSVYNKWIVGTVGNTYNCLFCDGVGNNLFYL